MSPWQAHPLLLALVLAVPGRSGSPVKLSSVASKHNSVFAQLFPKATGSSAEPARARIPLRFWIALTLSATVVGFLAAMGALYGTKNALFWSHLYV